MNMRWNTRVQCDVDIIVPFMSGSLSIVDLEATVTVYRGEDRIEIDDSSFEVHGWRGNVRSSNVVKRSSQSLEDRVIYEAIMSSIETLEHEQTFEDALREAQEAQADDAADWMRDERMMAAE